MSLRIGSREFAPPYTAALLTVAVLTRYMLRSRSWQVGRAREKQAMIKSFTAGRPVEHRMSKSGTSASTGCRAPGTYGLKASSPPARQVLIDDMPSQRGPARISRADAFRGAKAASGCCSSIVARCRSATRRDSAGPGSLSPEFRTRVAVGSIHCPLPGIRIGNAGVGERHELAARAEFPAQQDIEKCWAQGANQGSVLLDPAAPNGYERVWRPAMQFGPERHLAYAIQWFAFAIVALILFIALSVRRHTGEASAPADSGSSAP